MCLTVKIFMNQGEIWQIGLDPTIGAEIKKSRPGLIINSVSLGKLPLCSMLNIQHTTTIYGIGGLLDTQGKFGSCFPCVYRGVSCLTPLRYLRMPISPERNEHCTG
jgi:hypothetical protein